MSFKSLFKRDKRPITPPAALSSLMSSYSMEVLPHLGDSVDQLLDVLPIETRVYIPQIEGISHENVMRAAVRFRERGFSVMPHIPARSVKDRAALERMLGKYRDDAGIMEALLIAGSMKAPIGAFGSSIELLETGLFERFVIVNG